MIRILHIFHEMSNGGVEHFVMDRYRCIDRTQVQFDFLVSSEQPGFFDKEIQALGGKIYRAYPLKKNPFRNYQDIARIVRENHYDIVHRHTGSAFGYWDLRAARHGGAGNLILHSHNNQAGNQLLHRLSQIFLKIPCHHLACSQEAGNWLFGKNDPFLVVKNAINCDKFAFDPGVREEVRRELHLENRFVVGHIGRFETQKNHQRLLHIFSQISADNPSTALVCVGVGSLQDSCMQEAKELGIDKHVLFLGTRSDVPRLMSAFDVFVLPSIYEGLPFVLVEAQASGLPCVVSTNVPAESNILGNTSFLSLDESDESWASRILAVSAEPKKRLLSAQSMKDAGYDLAESAQTLCAYYNSLLCP